jgi:hypothetical protein
MSEYAREGGAEIHGTKVLLAFVKWSERELRQKKVDSEDEVSLVSVAHCAEESGRVRQFCDWV